MTTPRTTSWGSGSASDADHRLAARLTSVVTSDAGDTAGDVVIDVHPASAAQTCSGCPWHVRVVYGLDEAGSLEARQLHVVGIDLGRALDLLRADRPLSEWRQLAQAWWADASDADYEQTSDLAARLLTPPSSELLEEVVTSGRAWGVPPTRVVAHRFGVSPATAREWVRRRRRG